MRKSFCIILFVFSFIYPVISFAFQSQIFNFTEKTIYYSIQGEVNSTKLQSFSSGLMDYQSKKLSVKTYTAESRRAMIKKFKKQIPWVSESNPNIQFEELNSLDSSNECEIEVYDHMDIFVAIQKDKLLCSIRVERLPKDYRL